MGDITWNVLSYSINVIYHFAILQIVAIVSIFHKLTCQTYNTLIIDGKLGNFGNLHILFDTS